MSGLFLDSTRASICLVHYGLIRAGDPTPAPCYLALFCSLIPQNKAVKLIMEAFRGTEDWKLLISESFEEPTYSSKGSYQHAIKSRSWCG